MASDSKPASEWQELLRIAQGTPLVVERVSIPEKGIAVEGASCVVYQPIYDAAGNYLGQSPVNVCQ